MSGLAVIIFEKSGAEIFSIKYTENDKNFLINLFFKYGFDKTLDG